MPPARFNGATVRIKESVRIKGVESYTLIGHGLVTGLANTGDSDDELTQKMIANMLKHFNLKVSQSSLKAGNSAAVTVTATIRKTAHKGDQVQCTVSSMGDAKSLLGGELLLTPLLGNDGNMWATAQGAVTTGGFAFGSTGSGGDSKVKNHPTVGILTNGAKLLRDVGVGLESSDFLTLFLRQPDFSTAANLAEAVNSRFFGSALAPDAATVKVKVPQTYRDENRVTAFIRDLEQISFRPDRPGKIVFNERTGTIIIGGDVKISATAISHGSISITIKNWEEVIMPTTPFTATTAEIERNQDTNVNDPKVKFFPVPTTTTVGDVVNILNGLGVSSQDIMIIFHALREAGALHAELVSM
ncbi:hypothetical protein BVX99_02645 [bacterium F16]|nr:hypothetical protein BVX99_02645 [bacterium F16]